MRTLLLSAVAALAMAAPASAQNVLANGSFESGFANWTLGNANVGTAPVVIAYGGTPATTGYPNGAFGEPILPNTVTSLSTDPVGNSLAYFSSDTANPQTLSQLVNLAGGQLYNIGFDYYAPQNGINNPNDATLSFTINGSPVGSVLTAGSASGTPAQKWINFNTTFIAPGSGSQPFAFEFRGLGSTAADFGIDRVYAIAAVPESATWAMMILGFGFVGASMRRRQAVRVSFA